MSLSKILDPSRRFAGVASRGRFCDRDGDSRSKHLARAAPCAEYSSYGVGWRVGGMDTDWLREAGSRASAKALKDAIGKCEHAGVASETLVRTGQIAEAIGQVAREEDVKHIVMGTRGLGGIQGLLLGSVATQVIHLAEVPITLIK